MAFEAKKIPSDNCVNRYLRSSVLIGKCANAIFWTIATGTEVAILSFSYLTGHGFLSLKTVTVIPKS